MVELGPVRVSKKLAIDLSYSSGLVEEIDLQEDTSANSIANRLLHRKQLALQTRVFF